MQRSCVCSFSYIHVLVSAHPICLPTAPPVITQLHSRHPLQTLLLQLAICSHWQHTSLRQGNATNTRSWPHWGHLSDL